MKLRLKVLIILASMWALISLTIFAYSRSELISDYQRLETRQVVDDLDQARKTLNNLLSAVNVINTDWAQWDDAYQFMKNKNNSFIESNLAFTTFKNSKINLILFYNKSGKLFYGLNYDLIKKKFIPVPPTLNNQLESEKSFTQLNSTTASKLGFMKTTQGYVVLSAQPILTSKGTGPVAGTIVMGSFFNDSQIIKLSDIINVKAHFYTLPLQESNPTLLKAYSHLIDNEKYYVSPSNSDYINGYTLINDINNKPIGLLSITSERSLYKEGMKTIARYTAIIVTIGIMFLIAIWFLLKIFVLDRVINVSKQIIDINSESQFTTRIKLEGNDEISRMVFAVNSLMELIELTQEQLKYRIHVRTEELERISKLNKNLSKEIDQQKGIEQKLREDESALRQMAYYDGLTGLPNRIFFNEILQKIIDKAGREGGNLAILFLDIDKFKQINDTYGHPVGDLYLKYIAQQLKNSIKNSDIAARLSGDEFVICLNNIKGKDLIDIVCNKLLKNTSEPLKTDHATITTSSSIGVSIYPGDGTTVEDLEKHADLAMYYAKKHKGNAFYYYDEIQQNVTVS